jgi:acyl carrier protein
MDALLDVLSPFELEIARLLVETLHLDDLPPEDIAPEEPLFGEGLGLDSIDALELALAIHKTYGVQLRSEDNENQRVFASLRALSQHIAQNRLR